MQKHNVFKITAALADPLRLSIMMYLIHGPASVMQLMHQLEASQSNVSNHLAVLKNAGVVQSTALGRQKIYQPANSQVAQLIELLMNMQDIPAIKIIKPIQFARTCYDHLAGKLGVSVFNALLQKGAIQYPNGGGAEDRQFFSVNMELGPNAGQVFADLGVDLQAVSTSKRRFAYGCRDWTERSPHLAGALGAEICHVFFNNKWIARKDDTRTVVLTSKGKTALRDIIDLNI